MRFKATKVHIEPTNKCNAFCSTCTRTNNPLVQDNLCELTLDDIKIAFDSEALSNLKAIKWCGNLGDPILCNDLIPMHEWFQSNVSDIQFWTHTNGGIQTTEWWTKLGEIYSKNPNSVVMFHIDGLEDTNHLYREGVKYNKIIENAKAFIAAGGKAYWVYIPFGHNEHQIEEAEELSKQIGFSKFVVKLTSRYAKKIFFYKDRKGVDKKLYPPTDPSFHWTDEREETGPIQCGAQLKEEIFIDAWGNITPCCWTGSFNARKDDEFKSLIKENINCKNGATISDVLKSDLFTTKIPSAELNVCNKNCQNGPRGHGLLIDGEEYSTRDFDEVSI